MAKKKNQDEEVLVDVGSSLTKAEKFFEDNRQAITIGAAAIFVIAAAYFGYTRYYLAPLEQEAQTKIFHAQRLFEKDSFAEAVNGYKNYDGFLDIAADYSQTKAGNLANYYGGISYLRLGEYENAIRLLDEFNTDDPIFSVLATTAIGDAFMELDQAEEALEYYQKAVRGAENSYAVPFTLQKAALTAEVLGDYEMALDYYQRIKSEYPDSKQAADIQKYIARAEGLI